MTSALQAHALGKRFGRVWALLDCNLEIPAGRVAALVGPNGAGKTTLLEIAIGLLRPTQGSVRLLEAPNGAGDAWLLNHVGFVAQDAPLYRNFSVRDMLAFGRHLNARWDEAIARARLHALRIPLDQQVGHLSGGQRAQLALALALAKRPELLILDEPVASLDPLARHEFLEVLMEDVAENGTSVVLSSHLVADMQRACDYVVILSEGRVRLSGDIDSLLAEHRYAIGPRSDVAALAHSHELIQQSHTDRQSSLLIRGRAPLADPRWNVRTVGLEELVLAYLRQEREIASVKPPAMALA